MTDTRMTLVTNGQIRWPLDLNWIVRKTHQTYFWVIKDFDPLFWMSLHLMVFAYKDFQIHFLFVIVYAAKLAKFSGNETMCSNSFSIHMSCLIQFRSFWSIFVKNPNSKARMINGSKRVKWIKKRRAISFDEPVSYDPHCKFVFLQKWILAIFVCYRSWEFKFHRNFKEWTNSKPL